MAHQFGKIGLRVLDQANGRFSDFVQIMRRDFGRHADRDAGSAIQKRERQAGRQESRLTKGAVVIGLELDGTFVKLTQEKLGNRRQTRFGIAHCRRAVTIARAKVTLPVNQRVTQ